MLRAIRGLCKKSMRDYLAVIGGTGFSRFFALLNTIVVAHALSMEDFGKFSMFMLFFFLAWIVPNALDTSFVRFARAEGEQDNRMAYLRMAVVLKLVFAIAANLLVAASAGFMARAFFDKPGAGHIIILAVAAGSVLCFLRSVAADQQEKDRYISFSLMNLAYHLVNFILLLTYHLLPLKMTLPTVLTIYSTNAFIIGILAFIQIFRLCGNIFRIPWILVKRFIAFSKWVLAVTVVYFVYLKIDLVMVTRYLSFEEVGIYNVAAQFVMVVSVMTASLSAVFLPRSIRAFTSPAMVTSYLKEAYGGVALVLVGIGVLAAVAPLAITLVYGAEYARAAGILRIILIGWMFTASYLPISFVFYAVNDSKTRFYLELGSLVMAVAMLMILVPRFGLAGAAWAIAISSVVYALVSGGLALARIRAIAGPRLCGFCTLKPFATPAHAMAEAGNTKPENLSGEDA